MSSRLIRKAKPRSICAFAHADQAFSVRLKMVESTGQFVQNLWRMCGVFAYAVGI